MGFDSLKIKEEIMEEIEQVIKGGVTFQKLIDFVT